MHVPQRILSLLFHKKDFFYYGLFSFALKEENKLLEGWCKVFEFENFAISLIWVLFLGRHNVLYQPLDPILSK